MPVWFQAIVVLAMVWIVARFIKRRTPLLHRYFIPSSIVGGLLLLLIGHQVGGIIPNDITGFLSQLPALLINVVFAGLFLGKTIPKPRQIWQQAGPMIAFGSTMAWGMYVIGILLVVFVLSPLFGAPPIFASLLEVSFSGGHGTAAGLAPMFAELGWADATDMALGLATFSIVAAVVTGLVIMNIYNRRSGRIFDQATMRVQQRRMIRNGYSLTNVTRALETNPRENMFVLLLIAVSIGLGWLMWHGLAWLENQLLGTTTDIRVFMHLPLFPLAMFGGLLVQGALRVTNRDDRVSAKAVHTFGSIALDLLIITAIGTMALNVIAHNIASFAVLAIAGVTWIVGAFFVLAPRIFKKHWFEYGMTDLGQAMGMTATGLLLNRLVDPLNRTGAREAFAYKQLAYEPFMGGGIVTAMAAIVIVEFGLMTAFIIALSVFVFWLVVGLLLGARRGKRQRRQGVIGAVASRFRHELDSDTEAAKS